MGILTENILTASSPAAYITIYTLGLAGLTVAARRRREARDETRGQRLPHAPTDAHDPLELAYLNGGTALMTRLVLYDLVRRGWLVCADASSVFTTDRHISRAEEPPSPNYLAPIEREVWRMTERPALLSELFGTRDLPGHLDAYGDRYARALIKRGLLHGESAWTRARQEMAAALALAVLPGLYRAGVAFSQGQGGWFAFLLWASLGAAALIAFARPRRRTDVGERYLMALRRTHDAMRDHLDTWGELATAHMRTLAALFGPNLLLAPPRRRARRAPGARTLPTNVEIITAEGEETEQEYALVG